MQIRHDWTIAQAKTLYEQPFADLLLEAQLTHRKHFDPNEVQISSLYSIKTGACPEDCAYCPQSAHYDTGVNKEKLLEVSNVVNAAKKAKASGATRFCMGASYRSPNSKEFPRILEMVKAVKTLGMETCLTVGMLNDEQVTQLETVGLDYYNHNLDTSPEFYEKIITTRTYQDRLDTLELIRKSKIHVCCGGIVGMGETLDDRLGLLIQLANLPEHPESVPINLLVRVEGTPLESQTLFNNFEFVRMIAAARIMMPKSYVRLSAGRNEMNTELHALCFFAGANSIHYGEKLLTTPLPDTSKDQELFKQLGIRAKIETLTSTESCCT